LNNEVDKFASALGLQGNILPVQSVGVQGDYRSYSYLATLSGNYPQKWSNLRTTAQNIPNTLHEINRVALVINKNLPLPKEIKQVAPMFLTPQTLDLIRQIDFEVTETIREAGLLPKISQLLTVLIPVAREQGYWSIAIRAVVTSDYMTARPARLGDELPWHLMQDLADKITQNHPIHWVMYDLTSKPPATVEWE
jgi:GMP synthase (glutamine-hydrolysing)